MPDRPEYAVPICPRCGYDQSGVAAAWDDACPLEGRCPECGHGFLWVELFDPTRRELMWYAGHASGARAMARRTVPTLLRMLLPWIFWSRYRVQARPDTRALMCWVLLVFVAVHLLVWPFLAFSFAAIDNGYALTPRGFITMVAELSELAWVDPALNGLVSPVWVVDYLDFDFAFFRGDGWRMCSLWRVPIGFGLTWVLVLSVLPWTRRAARLRRRHVVRAFVLQCVMIMIAFEMFRMLFPAAHAMRTNGWTMALVSSYFAVSVWSIAWWWGALRSGWGIRSWTLLILGTIASAVGAAVAVSIEHSIDYLLT